MFDLKGIENHWDEYFEGWKKRGQPALLESAAKLQDQLKKRRQLIQEHQAAFAKRNEASQMIAQKKRAGEDVSSLINEQKAMGGRIKELDDTINQFQERFENLIQRLPNIPAEDVPVGSSSEDNVEVRKWGTPPHFSFSPRSHEAIGEAKGWFDFQKAAEISGARFAILKGFAARLERALAQFMLDFHTSEKRISGQSPRPYVEAIPPFIVNSKTLYGTAQLPKFKEDLFELKGFDYFLIPTAEVPLTNFHSGEILSLDQLPFYYVAETPCFRSEAGSHGKDMKGLIRQHQFRKVELVKICRPDDAPAEHEGMRRDAELILEQLELPYRTVVLCTGDMGFAARKTYDIEVWLPSQGAYREISSVSHCGDFQARRMNTRFRDGDGKTVHVHTLNGSGLAVGRTVIAVLENYQTEDGRVRIPKVLQKYFGGSAVSP